MVDVELTKDEKVVISILENTSDTYNIYKPLKSVTTLSIPEEYSVYAQKHDWDTPLELVFNEVIS